MNRLDALSRDARAERAAADLGRAAAANAPTLGEAAGKFEAYLLGQIFAHASKPLSEQPLLDGSSASRMYRELYLQEVASQVGAGGGLGLARLLEAGSGAAREAPTGSRAEAGAPSADSGHVAPTQDPL
jgi:Rod binding domain-containing protein